MSQHETYSFTATLVPQAGTASLLRIVSTLHSRGVHVHHLEHAADSPSGVTVTGRVTSGNAARTTVEASLRRMLEVVHVSTRLEPALDLVSTNS
jgi:hypothetical protein